MSQPPAEREAGFGDVPVLLFIRGLTFVFIVVGILVGLHVYLGTRLFAGLAAPWSGLAWGALWFAFTCIPLGMILGRTLPRAISVKVQWVGFVWMGAFGIMLTTTAASDLLLWGAAHASTGASSLSSAQPLLVLGIAVPALLYGFRVARGTPTVVQVTVPVKGLGKALDGYRIVQLTDIHIGDTLNRDFVARVVAKTNALKPDAIALTGDAIEGSVKKCHDEVQGFAQLEARDGKFYVTGNHEYYHGGTAWEAQFGKLGFTVLHNQHRVVERDGAQLVIAGVTDLEGARFSEAHRPDPDAAFEGAPAGAPRVLLAHQPRFAKHVQNHDVALQLSGHTHGGQIFPFMFFVRLQQPVIAGLKRLWGVLVYTSRGTGYWGPPFRIGPVAEIAEITLRAE